jgi:plastocyanin
MSIKFYLTPIFMLFVLMYFGSVWSHDQNALGSVSGTEDDGAAAQQPSQQFQPINGTSGIANDVFNTHEMTLGNNIKNLVILIPNEGHHGPQVDEDRFLDQPFIPQNVILNLGTNIVWFNGDVGHDHNLVITNNSTGETVQETGVFPQFEVRSVALNGTGNYHYTDTEDYEEGFVMSGNIQVVDQTQAPTPAMELSGNTQISVDTVGILMVPTQDIQTYTTDLESRGFNIEGTHNFKDLRGGQSGTGDEQTLIVWTTGGMDLSTVASNLQEFSLGLPYS